MTNIRETDNYIVMEMVSEQGNKYEVGYPKAAGYSVAQLQGEIAATEEFMKSQSEKAAKYMEIDWKPNEQSTTSRGAIRIGIVGGYVNDDAGVIYDCQVNFANTARWSFIFKDKTGDTYSCSTPRNGNHYIDYNSKDPTMVGVR